MEEISAHIVAGVKTSVKTPVAIFDVDGTLLDDSKGASEYYGPNTEIVKIARECRRNGVKIIILTARPLDSKIATRVNLNMHGIPFDKMIINEKSEPPAFKRSIRSQIERDHNVILAIGDKVHDYDSSGPSVMRVRVINGRPSLQI